MLLKGYIVPHPPILLVGNSEDKERLEKTLHSFNVVNEELKMLSADTIVLITPHGPSFVDGLCVYDGELLDGNFSDFGHKEITGKWDNDISFIETLLRKAQEADIPFVKLDEALRDQFNLSEKLDHGALVPLKLIEEGIGERKIVVINYGLLPVDSLYKFGRLIADTFEMEGKAGVVIASGDLSHYLLEEGPYGYRQEGPIFDKAYVDAFEKNQWQDLLFVEEELRERAGECGKRSVEILLGAFDGYIYETKKYSYEGPFGVGYLLGSLTPTGENKESHFDWIINHQENKIRDRISKESPVVQLARKSIEKYLETGEIYRSSEDLPIEESGKRVGVFVSLKDAGGLRGCMGSTGGIAPTVEEEIIETAIKAATRDPRFEEVSLDELGGLTISVDILSPSEEVLDKATLDPKHYGVIVKAGHKHGLLLPNLEGIESIEQQLSIVLNKANINPEMESYELYKFTVKRYY